MASLLRFVAVIASLLLIVGFFGFVSDKSGEASRKQVNKIAKVDPTAAEERERERKHSKVREGLDDANDVLLRPFASVMDFQDPWPRRGFPTILGLLVYGGGLALLANYLPKAQAASGDWRTAR